MTQYTYSWKPGSRIIAAVKPELAGAVFNAIEQRDGWVTPSAVLDQARPPDASLHPAFEWDDGAAAEHWRLTQAGHLIRSLVIVRRTEELPPAPPVRAFVRVVEPPAAAATEDGAASGYSSIVRVMAQPDARALLLQRARDELQTWQRRYRDLTEFAAVFDAMTQLPLEAVTQPVAP